MQKRIALLTVLFLSFATLAAAQQDKSQRPSPPAHAQCKCADGKTINVDYSSPRIQDPKTHQPRKIFGGLAPHGEVWRAPPNDAPPSVTDPNLRVGGKDVPAGSYTIFTMPNQEKWTLIISRKTGEWGIPYPGEGDDLARVDMNVSKAPSQVENFTIDFDQKGTGCSLRLDWETTRASVEISEKR